MEGTGRLWPAFLCSGVPPAEWKPLTRKTEWSLEGKAHPSKQFPSSTGILVGFGKPSCVWLFPRFTWQRFVFKCRQAATQAGSLGVMDAARCSVITLSADGFLCSLLPPSESGRGGGGGSVCSMETLRCRRLIAEPRRADVMLETRSSLVTSCQGLQRRCGHGCLLGTGSGTGLQEQERHREGNPECVREALKRRANGHVREK